MRCQICGRLAPGAARLCPQCARAARPSGVRPSGTGPRPPAPPSRYPAPPGSPPVPRPAPPARPGRAAGVQTPPAAREVRPPRRRKRRGPGLLPFLVLLAVGFLAGYLLHPAGRTPAQPGTEISQGQSGSGSAQGQAPAASAVRAEAEALIPHFPLRWYLQQLDDTALENFCALYRALMDFQEKVTFPNPVTEEDLQLLFFLAEYECPEILQLPDGSRYTYHTRGDEILYVTVHYGLQRDDYAQRARLCAEIAQRAAAQAQGLSEWERELAAIRYLNANCVYDADAADAANAYGSLVMGVAKCGGISLGFKWIAEEMGLTTFILSGSSRDGSPGHAWNCIRIDGAYSDVDVTAEVGFPGESRECAFRSCNVPRQRIAEPYILREYITDHFTLPEADSMDGSYYVRTGCYVRSGESPEPWLRELCAQVERDGSGSLTLQFESQSDYDAFYDAFTAAMNDLPFSVTYNGWHDDTGLWRKQTVHRN